MAEINKSIEQLKTRFIGDSERHATMVDKMLYMDDLAEDIGVKPNWLKLGLRDPYLTFKCITGPLLAYQYRIGGEHKSKPQLGIILTRSFR